MTTCSEAVLPFEGDAASCRAERLALRVFIGLLVGNALAAYNVGSIPIPWIAQALLVVFVPCLMISTNQSLRIPGMAALGLYIAWAGLVTIVQCYCYNYSDLMPPLATTSYPVFMLLRFVNLFSVVCQIWLTYYLLAAGHEKSVVRVLVVVGGLVAAAAIYIYVAQVLGLGEPPRTRVGTGGGEPRTVFTYAFHRAMGTFREPSHLAEWALVPFFLGLLSQHARGFGLAILIGLTILLTGSLTGIGGAVLGFGAALVLLNPLRRGTGKAIVGLAVILGISYALFSLFAVSYGGEEFNLIKVISDRVAPILAGGMGESNRAYIYDYFWSTPIHPWGLGLGNSVLCFDNDMGINHVTGFLNLYFTTLYSTGYVGCVLMGLFLLQPILLMWRVRYTMSYQRQLVLLAAYCSWLVVFGVHADELPIIFGAVYAIVVYEARCDAAVTGSEDGGIPR